MGNVINSCEISCCRRYEDEYVIIPERLRHILSKQGYGSYMDSDDDDYDWYPSRCYGTL